MIRTITTALTLVLALGSHAQTRNIDFDQYQHGEILSDLGGGVTLRTVNTGGGPDLGVAFDTTRRCTADWDLEGPNGRNGRWHGGNINRYENLGRALIIQENSYGIGDGIADRPDDEGSRNAGSFTFNFATPIVSFCFDVIDIGNWCKPPTGYFVTMKQGDNEVARVSFAELAQRDPSIRWGNNSANSIAALSAQELGVSSFDTVTITMGGSGAVDNVCYDEAPPTGVPTPAAALPGLLLLGSLSARRRRRNA